MENIERKSLRNEVICYIAAGRRFTNKQNDDDLCAECKFVSSIRQFLLLPTHLHIFCYFLIALSCALSELLIAKEDEVRDDDAAIDVSSTLCVWVGRVC